MENNVQKLPPNVVAIIPVYNAGDLVASVVRDLQPYVHRIWLVDDGSTDGCTEGLDSSITQVVHIEENQGKGFALLHGYARALKDDTVDCVVAIDADGQHDVLDLPRLYEAFEEAHADFLIGARDFNMGLVPFRSRIGNKMTRMVSRVLLGTTLEDTQSGYRLASRKFLSAALDKIRGGRYETEMEMLALAVHGDFKVASKPIRTLYDEGNSSSHFHVLRDSFRICRKLFSVWLKHLVR